MISRFLLSFLCLCFFSHLHAQIFESAAIFSGNFHDYGYKVEVSNDGNLFVLGEFADSITLGGTLYVNQNIREQFLVKCTPSGAIMWSEAFGLSVYSDIMKALAIDDSNNVILSLSFTTNTPYIGDSLYAFPAGFTNALIKYSSNGTLLWVKPYQAMGFNAVKTDEQGNIYATGGMDGIFAMGSMSATGATVGGATNGAGLNTITAKIDPAGNPIWLKVAGINSSSPYNANCHGYDVVIDTAGAVYVVGEFGFEMFFDPPFNTKGIVAPGAGAIPSSLFMMKYNSSGTLQWGRLINTFDIHRGTGQSLELGDDGNIYLSGNSVYSLDLGNGIQFQPQYTIAGFVAVVSPEGIAQNGYVLRNGGRGTFTDVQVVSPGVVYMYVSVEDSFSFAGQHYTFVNDKRNFITKIDLNDVDDPEKWVLPVIPSQRRGNMAYDRANEILYFTSRVDNSYSWGPFNGTPRSSDAFVVGIMDTQVIITKNTVRGKVLFDQIPNCNIDSPDMLMKQQVLKLTPGPRYASTDAAGNYSFYGVDSIAYNIELLPRNVTNDYINSVCPASGILPLHLDTLGVDTAGFNFYLDGLLCPVLRTEVNMLQKRLCSSSFNHIAVCNDGVVTAYNVELKVSIPAYLQVTNTSQPYMLDSNSRFVYMIDSIAPFDCIQVIIQDNVSCDINNLGFTACISAEVQQPACIPPDSNWTGAEVEVTVNCRQGSDATMYTIRNTGNGDMADSTEYRVYLDSALVYTGMIKLAAGDSVTFMVVSSGKTVRVEADQVPYHPSSVLALTYYEGCGKDIPIAVSKRFITQFPLEDGDIVTDISCEELIGSFDPNDKKTIPQGFTNRNYIYPSTRLNYTIRFQNTGTAPAFRVLIIDTLSANIDISSLRLAGSSHNMQLSVTGGNRPILKFLFDPIILPDSTSDPLGSQGYVAFSVQPYDTLIPHSVIRNFADIYFDNNPAIRTNTERHEIWLDTIKGTSDVVQCLGAPDASAMTDTAFCGKDTISLFANNASGVWDLLSGNGTLYNDTSSSALILNSDTGYYQLVWTTELCLDKKFDTVNIYNLSADKPVLIYNNESLVATGNYVTYQWYFNDSLLAFTSDSIPAFEDGVYKAIGYNSYCTSEVSDPYIVFTSGVSTNDAYFSIGPNPFENILLVKRRPSERKDCTVKLFNAVGVLVANYIINEVADELVIDASKLTTGLYLYMVTSDSPKRIEKGTLIKR